MTAFAQPFDKIAASLSVSTEFMDNFRQVRLIEPQTDFLTLQNVHGNTILLSISTDNKLHITVEKNGSKTGWEQFDITPGMNGTPMEVSQIAAVQSGDLSRIDLLIAAKNTSGPVKDHLMVGLGHSSDASLNNWDWEEIPDDRKNAVGKPLSIADIFIANSGSGPTIVVDTKANDGSKSIERFYVDPEGKQHWNMHGLAADITSGTAQMCVGRSYHQRVDGIYTLGKNNDENQIVYTPLYNKRNPGLAPPVINLEFPNQQFEDFMALAAASLPHDSRGMTTLFVAGGGNLYCLHGEDQKNGAKLKVIQTDDLYHNVERLFVNVSKNKIAIWGRNSHQEIFYTSCQLRNFENPQDWSKPLPLLNNVTQLSTYINKASDCITFFAPKSGRSLLKATQAANSSVWNFQTIALPNPGAPANKEKAYVTHVVVKDAHNCPLADIDVLLSVGGSAGVFINDQYCALDDLPQKVRTNNNGELHITEWVEGSRGTIINVQLAPQKEHELNPMHKSIQKMAKLDSVASLNDANYTDPKGQIHDLIQDKPKIAGAQASQLVSNIQALSHAWNDVSNQAIEIASDLEDVARENLALLHKINGLDNGIDYVSHLASDVLQWASETTDSLVSIVKDTASEAWHFIVKNGGKVVGFVIKTCDEVMKGLELVWKTIVGGLKKLWNYLKYVFDAEDIQTTKEVFEKFIGYYFDDAKDWLINSRENFHRGIKLTKSALDHWAEVGSLDFSALDHSIMSYKHGNDTSSVQSAPSKMLQDQFKTNAGNSDFKGFDTVFEDVEDLIHILEEQISEADGEIKTLIRDVRALIASKDGILSPKFIQLVRRVLSDIGALALTVLDTIVEAIIELFIILIDAIRAALTTPLQIPVLSESLEFFFGIELPSVLDIILYVGAAPVTIGYKILNDKAPFPKNDPTTDLILNPKNYREFKAAVQAVNDKNIMWVKDTVTLSDRFKDIIFGSMHIVGGVAGYLKTGLEAIQEEESGEQAELSLPIGVLGVVGYGKDIIASVLETPQILSGSPMTIFSDMLGKIGILQQLAFRILPSEMGGISLEPIASGVDVVLSTAGLVPLSVSTAELCENPPERKEMTVGILDYLSGTLGYVATVTGFAGMVDGEELSKQLLVLIAAETGAFASELELAEGIVMVSPQEK